MPVQGAVMRTTEQYICTCTYEKIQIFFRQSVTEHLLNVVVFFDQICDNLDPKSDKK